MVYTISCLLIDLVQKPPLCVINRVLVRNQVILKWADALIKLHHLLFRVCAYKDGLVTG